MGLGAEPDETAILDQTAIFATPRSPLPLRPATDPDRSLGAPPEPVDAPEPASELADPRPYSPVSGPLDLRAAAAASAFEQPKPLTRRPAAEPLVPLDPQYISDSVQARSDWMASAVVYEEMSSLLRTAPGQPDHARNGQSSAPRAPEASAWRSPMEGREGYVDRFKATITRDPEQLRARLSAFQSATARGRAEAKDDPWRSQFDAGPDHQGSLG
jgi:hypothetical protein